MERIIGRVNGLEVIRSGMIVGESGSKFELLPFDDSDYSIDIVVKVDDSISGAGTWEVNSDISPVKITIHRPWGFFGKSISMDLPAAQTGTHQFYINIIIELIGTTEKFNQAIYYSIYRKPK